MSRLGSFIFGFVVACVVIVLGAFLFVREGGVQMAVGSPELPFEATFARMAIHASFADSVQLQNPVRFDSDNITGGAEVYKTHCAACHGLPGKTSGIAKRMFPHPPQLFVPSEMVTNDPEGVTYWKVTNGIRLSGMPEFRSVLSETQRWQLAMLLSHADKLPPSAQAALSAH